MDAAMVALLLSTLNLFGVSEIRIWQFSSLAIVLGSVIPPGLFRGSRDVAIRPPTIVLVAVLVLSDLNLVLQLSYAAGWPQPTGLAFLVVGRLTWPVVSAIALGLLVLHRPLE
jgi:hypothetical protein